jgi:hypothetical protein
VGCDRLPQECHGKEGVDGSSPSEDFVEFPPCVTRYGAGEHTTHRRKALSIEQNKALVRRFYAELDNLNPVVIDELVAENFVNHSPTA